MRCSHVLPELWSHTWICVCSDAWVLWPCRWTHQTRHRVAGTFPSTALTDPHTVTLKSNSEKRELSCTPGGEASRCSRCGNQCGCSSGNTELPYDPSAPLLAMRPDQTLIQKDTRSPTRTAADSQQTKQGDNLSARRQRSGRRRCGPGHSGAPLGREKERNCAISSKRDATRDDHTR